MTKIAASTAFVASPGRAATQSHHEWAQAVAALERLEEAARVHHATVFKPAYDAVTAAITRAGLRFPGHTAEEVADRCRVERETCPAWDAINDEAERLGAAISDAFSLLVNMPAPHPQALLWKMERMFGDDDRGGDSYGDSWCSEYLQAVMSDARRFLSAGRA